MQTNKQIIDATSLGLTPENFCEDSLQIVSVLQQAGFEAYLVGGCIRDSLSGIKPKDFDIATDAHPEQVTRLFKRSQIIGRRFKIVHVYQGREYIEVTTFRGHSDAIKTSNEGMLLRDNIYGSMEEDAMRRDYTANALYYNPTNNTIIDFFNGIEHIQQKRLCIIGEPEQRFQEDPVRMLRAIRFQVKLDFTLDDNIQSAINSQQNLLAQVHEARRFDESLKLLLKGQGEATFKALISSGLATYLFPELAKLYEKKPETHAFLHQALRNSDKRVAEGKPVIPVFLYAALLWPLFVHKLLQEQDISQIVIHDIASEIFTKQNRHTAITRRTNMGIRDIWIMQFRLPRYHGKRAERLYAHPRFRAAYDFLLLREQSELLHWEQERVSPFGVADWWTEYQKTHEPPPRVRHNDNARGSALSPNTRGRSSNSRNRNRRNKSKSKSNG